MHDVLIGRGNERRTWGYGELSYAEKFVLHLKYGRDHGVAVGPIPAGGKLRTPLYLDPEKARSAAFLSQVDFADWRRLQALGIASLERKGIARPAQRPGGELVDRYDVDFTRVLAEIAILPNPWS